MVSPPQQQMRLLLLLGAALACFNLQGCSSSDDDSTALRRPGQAAQARVTSFSTELEMDDVTQFDASKYLESVAAAAGVDKTNVKLADLNYTVSVGYSLSGNSLPEEQSRNAIAQAMEVEPSAVYVAPAGNSSNSSRRLATTLDVVITTENVDAVAGIKQKSSDPRNLKLALSRQGITAEPVVARAPKAAVHVVTQMTSTSGTEIKPPASESLRSQVQTRMGVTTAVRVAEARVELVALAPTVTTPADTPLVESAKMQRLAQYLSMGALPAANSSLVGDLEAFASSRLAASFAAAARELESETGSAQKPFACAKVDNSRTVPCMFPFVHDGTTYTDCKKNGAGDPGVCPGTHDRNPANLHTCDPLCSGLERPKAVSLTRDGSVTTLASLRVGSTEVSNTPVVIWDNGREAVFLISLPAGFELRNIPLIQDSGSWMGAYRVDSKGGTLLAATKACVVSGKVIPEGVSVVSDVVKSARRLSSQLASSSALQTIEGVGRYAGGSPDADATAREQAAGATRVSAVKATGQFPLDASATISNEQSGQTIKLPGSIDVGGNTDLFNLGLHIYGDGKKLDNVTVFAEFTLPLSHQDRANNFLYGRAQASIGTTTQLEAFAFINQVGDLPYVGKFMKIGYASAYAQFTGFDLKRNSGSFLMADAMVGGSFLVGDVRNPSPNAFLMTMEAKAAVSTGFTKNGSRLLSFSPQVEEKLEELGHTSVEDSFVAERTPVLLSSSSTNTQGTGPCSQSSSDNTSADRRLVSFVSVSPTLPGGYQWDKQVSAMAMFKIENLDLGQVFCWLFTQAQRSLLPSSSTTCSQIVIPLTFNANFMVSFAYPGVGVIHPPGGTRTVVQPGSTVLAEISLGDLAASGPIAFIMRSLNILTGGAVPAGGLAITHKFKMQMPVQGSPNLPYLDSPIAQRMPTGSVVSHILALTGPSIEFELKLHPGGSPAWVGFASLMLRYIHSGCLHPDNLKGRTPSWYSMVETNQPPPGPLNPCKAMCSACLAVSTAEILADVEVQISGTSAQNRFRAFAGGAHVLPAWFAGDYQNYPVPHFTMVAALREPFAPFASGPLSVLQINSGGAEFRFEGVEMMGVTPIPKMALGMWGGMQIGPGLQVNVTFVLDGGEAIEVPGTNVYIPKGFAFMCSYRLKMYDLFVLFDWIWSLGPSLISGNPWKPETSNSWLGKFNRNNKASLESVTSWMDLQFSTGATIRGVRYEPGLKFSFEHTIMEHKVNFTFQGGMLAPLDVTMGMYFGVNFGSILKGALDFVDRMVGFVTTSLTGFVNGFINGVLGAVSWAGLNVVRSGTSFQICTGTWRKGSLVGEKSTCGCHGARRRWALCIGCIRTPAVPTSDIRMCTPMVNIAPVLNGVNSGITAFGNVVKGIMKATANVFQVREFNLQGFGLGTVLQGGTTSLSMKYSLFKSYEKSLNVAVDWSVLQNMMTSATTAVMTFLTNALTASVMGLFQSATEVAKMVGEMIKQACANKDQLCVTIRAGQFVNYKIDLPSVMNAVGIKDVSIRFPTSSWKVCLHNYIPKSVFNCGRRLSEGEDGSAPEEPLEVPEAEVCVDHTPGGNASILADDSWVEHPELGNATRRCWYAPHIPDARRLHENYDANTGSDR